MAESKNQGKKQGEKGQVNREYNRGQREGEEGTSQQRAEARIREGGGTWRRP